MRKSIIFAIFCNLSLAAVLGQNRGVTNNYVYAFAVGSSVNVRAEPNPAARVVGQLALGQRVEQDYNYQDTMMNIKGVEGRWVSIKADNKSGFVWSPLLALGIVKNGTNPDIMFLLGRTNSQDSMKIVVMQAGKLLQTLVFSARYSGEGGERFMGFSTLGKAGITNIDELLAVYLGAMACGGTSEDIMFAWDGQRLHHFFTAADSSEGGGDDNTWIARTYIVLPIDADGEKGVIHYYSEMGDNVEDEDETEAETSTGEPRQPDPIVYSEKIHKVMVWNGTTLVEKKQ